MDKHDATEQAYHNGYADGFADGFADARKQYRPCRMGDMVWGIRRQAGIYNHVKYGRVSHMEYSQDMELLVTIRNACKGVWGKTVFATKEEALEALERIERRYG